MNEKIHFKLAVLFAILVLSVSQDIQLITEK